MLQTLKPRRTRALLTAALCWIGALCGATAARANTLYVATTGSGLVSYAQMQSAATPSNYNNAINKALSGDVIEFKPGIYTKTNMGTTTGFTVMTVSKSNITLRAQNRAADPSVPVSQRSVIQVSANLAVNYYHTIYVQGQTNVLIDGFEVDGSPVNTADNRGVANGITIESSSHVTCQYNIVHDNPQAGIVTNPTRDKNNANTAFRSAAVDACDYITIDHNIVYNNCFFAIFEGSGISLLNSKNTDLNDSGFHNRITNNRVFNNIIKDNGKGTAQTHTDGNGIIVDTMAGNDPPAGYTPSYPYTGFTDIAGNPIAKTLVENNLSYFNGGRGLHVFQSGNVTVRNNTAYKNGQDPTYVGADLTAGRAKDVLFCNNIAYAEDGGQAQTAFSVTNTTFRYNLYFNGTATLGTGDVVGNPLFKSAGVTESADFRVAPNSPATNSGDATAGNFAPLDFAATARPQGAAPDKGAYELLPAPGNLSATPAASSVALSWSAVPGALSYTLKRGTSAGALTTLFPNLTGTTYTDNTPANGTTYFYAVSASNASSESPDSLTVNATPLVKAAQTRAIISEFRFRGASATAGGATDEYVEIYNTLNAPLDISGWTLKTNSGTGTSPVIQTTVVPANTPPLPPIGHFLFTGANYSLGSYGASNASLNGDSSDDSGALLLDASGATQDAVGFASSNAMFREGAGLASAPTVSGQYAWMRDYVVSQPKDTDDSLSDWVFVSNTGTAVAGTNGALTPQLGAPSPEGSASPSYYNHLLTITLLDPAVAQGVAPNRVRTGVGNSGTVSFRRTITNQSGRTITKLRFSIVRITSLNSPAYTTNQADVRLVSSSDEPVVATSSGNVAVYGVALEAPSQATPGGAMGSSTSFTSILSAPLLPGQSRNVSFQMNIITAGNFLIFFNSLGIGS